MTPLRTAPEVAALFLAACRAELEALKPGNVHASAPGHGMQVWHFARSAEAAAPFIADPALRVGERIWRAMEASFAIAGCNTNLGILLLAAPLARAADTAGPASGSGSSLGHAAGPQTIPPLRDRLAAVLADLDTADARDAFRAIALANPAGLGHVEIADVNAPPPMGLRAAMQLAADRDRIARAYASGYAELFELALPSLACTRAIAESGPLAVSTLHMTLLAAFPDSHVARKHGAQVASAVMAEARALAPLYKPVATPAGMEGLLAFDAALKARGFNPGTTADLVVATLFAEGLDSSRPVMVGAN